MKFKRVFLIVLDSLGVGGASDSESYGDKGANTLGNIIKNYDLFIPNLKKLGFLNTLNMNNKESEAYYTIARPKNKGKDSLSGHYELMCIENNVSFKTYMENGFPRDMLEAIANKTNKGIIGNIIGSPINVINRLGARHMETGSLIIYTTGDSDLEVSAHEDIIPINELREYAEIIRNVCEREEWKVGRVVARPFNGTPDNFKLTTDTRYYTLTPPNKSVLDILKNNELQVISIGKVCDLYNGFGITKIIKSGNNQEGINKLIDIMDKNFTGLCFLNLSDFDTIYGHNRDVKGYAEEIENLDVEIPIILNKLELDDLLIITADHGCDPTMPGFNHTRENVPFLAYSRIFKEPKQLDVLESLSDIGATIVDNYKLEDRPWMGTSFLDKLK